MEAMVGLLSYVYEEQVEADLELNLNNTFLTSYMVDNDKTAAIDFLQEKVSTIVHTLKQTICFLNNSKLLLTIGLLIVSVQLLWGG